MKGEVQIGKERYYADEHNHYCRFQVITRAGNPLTVIIKTPLYRKDYIEMTMEQDAPENKLSYYSTFITKRDAILHLRKIYDKFDEAITIMSNGGKDGISMKSNGGEE